MPTAVQVINRTPIRPQDRHYVGKVTQTSPLLVALDPGTQVTAAVALNAVAYVVGARVLVLVTRSGNYVLGRITP